MSGAIEDLFGAVAAASGDVPAYRRIADAIAAAVAEGRLCEGDRLPTQRALAQALGVALPTVTRGYQKALERGLITSTVGRGSFVAGIPDLRDDQAGHERHDMAVNAPARGAHEAELRKTVKALSDGPDVGELLGYAPDIGLGKHRQAAASWLERRGLAVSKADVAITHGGQHALVSALAAAASPGDVLAVEELTYPGVRSAARLLGLRLVAVALDEHGLVPEALDALCRSSAPPTAVYTVPTGQNPTATTMPSERRRHLAAVARENDLAVIEDDVFGLLAGHAYADPPPVATFCPERTTYFTSFSKTLAPGLRCGVLTGPPDVMQRVGPIIRATVFNPSPLDTAVAMSWVNDGTADRLLAWQRREAAQRARLAEKVLTASTEVRLVRTSALHAWVELKDPWTAADAIDAASAAAIDISPTSFFEAPSATRVAGLRLCLGNAESLPDLEQALRRLVAAWQQGPLWDAGTRV